jgi:hypothetical protein
MEQKEEVEEEEEVMEEEEPVEIISTPAPSSRPTSSPTESNIFAPESNQDDEDQLILLPFMVHLQGTHMLGSTNEIVFRWHLQEYLSQFFNSPLLEVSSVLESIQLDRPWVTTIDGGRRTLQEDGDSTTAPTNSSQNLIMQYQGRVVLKDSAAFFDTQPTLDLIHEAQIVALEDTASLQEYFIQLLFRDDDEAAPLTQPVVFLEVQLDGRPLLELDPAVTWDRIEALNNTDTTSNEQQPPQDQDENAGSSSPPSDQKPLPDTHPSSTPSGLSAPVTAVIIGVTLIFCAIAGAILCMIRARRQRQMLTKLPGAPDVHAMEVVSDVDSEANLDDIVYDKSLLRQQKNSSPTMTRTSSWCEEDEDGGSNGGGKSKGYIPFGRVSSLFRKSRSTQSSANGQGDEEEGFEAFPPITAAGSNGTDTSTSHGSAKNVNQDQGEMKVFPHGTNDYACARVAASSPVIDLTSPGRNPSGIELVEREAPQAASRSVLSSPNKRPKASQEEHDELDSVVAHMNLYTMPSYDEEESMMGYSLASNNDSVAGNNESRHTHKQEETEVSIFANKGNIRSLVHSPAEPPGLSRQSSGGEDGDSSNSDPSTRMSMLPGVQNLLNTSNKRNKPKNSGTKKWKNKKNRPPGFFSSDSESAGTLEHVLEEVSAKSDSSGSVFIEDDAESVEVVDVAHHHSVMANPELDDDANSSYKEIGSLKESDSSVASDADKSVDMHGSGGLSALGYYNRNSGDQTAMLPQITPVPSEEMDEMVLKTPVIGNSGMGLMTSSAVIRDDVSDAPSDERNTIAAMMQSSLMGALRHTPSVDSDPAVVDYLMKERRQRTRRKRAHRKQPPVTMEV